MGSYFKIYKIPLLLLIVVVCALSLYIYKINSDSKPIINSDKISVDKIEGFNALIPGVFILNQGGEDYEALSNIFSCVGYDVKEGHFEELKRLKETGFILVVPENEARRLKEEECVHIIQKIIEGQKVITWGKTPLGEGLGLTFLNKNKKIAGYTWRGITDTPVAFLESANLKEFSLEQSYEVLAEDAHKSPVMIAGGYGKGEFIYSSIPLISSRGLSYEHFPLLMDAVKEQFHILPAIARDDLALYVDIDYHKEESPSALADRIKSYGVDQINLSVWYSQEEYGNRYKEIIEECHKRGISVYAWFELPFVSIDFWDKHPEWREQTASGQDAHIDWRRLMAISNPEALAAIKQNTREIIESFDWDGVDIAEIYFESPGQGFEEKEKFTPMNDSFRKSFQERYGADPKEAFDPLSKHYWKFNKEMKQNIIDYRVELITRLHEEFLMLCEELREQKPYLKTSVTVIDSIADQNMREHIGVDAKAIAELQNKYHFMLQIEDPFTLWNLGPERYKVIGEEYRNIMSSGDTLAIDINVIERGGEVYPTKKQRGLELYQLINSASRHTDKVIIYALGTLEDSDMWFVPYAASSDVEVKETAANEYTTKADSKFIWNTDTAGRTYYIDGVKWPFVSEQGVIIPGGEHKLKVQTKRDNSKLFIQSINGEISNVTQDKSINFSYSSEGRFYITASKKPSRIKLDGHAFKAEMKEIEGRCTILLPEGKHQVKIWP